VAEKEILSCLNEKPGRVLHLATAEMVKQFCVSDEISKIMLGQMIMFLLTQKARRFILRHDTV
jgi:hypothetical protein